VKTHADIDHRSLALARLIAERIDADPARTGLEKARSVCRNWCNRGVAAASEWMTLLDTLDWPGIRALLLEESEEGRRRRQNSPFCGVLTPRERWAFFRDYSRHEARTT
jgi:hypothetical protein